MKKLFIFSLLILICVMPTVSAETMGGYYSPAASSGKGYMWLRYGEMNASYLHDHIFTDGKLDTNQTVLIKNDDHNYTFNNLGYLAAQEAYKGSLNLDGYTLQFNSPNDTRFYGGPWDFSNSTLKASTGKLIFEINNVTEDIDNATFYGIGMILYPDSRYFDCYNIKNTKIYDGIDGIIIYKGLANSQIQNIYMENMSSGYLNLVNSTNVTVKNFRVERIQPVLGSGTGFYFGGAGNPNKYGTWEGGHDNHAYNIYMNGTGRSGFDMSQYEYNSTGTNITVIHSGHNGIDLHGQWNVTLRNVTSIDSDFENFMITSPNGNAGDHLIHNETGAVDKRENTTVSHDIFVYDYHSRDATGSGMSSNRVVNMWIINMTSDNDAKVINHNFAKNTTFLNVTGTNIRGNSAVTFGMGGTYGYAEDVYLIDSSFRTIGAPITMYATKNARVLNVYSVAGYVFGGWPAEYSNNYYLDALVTDSNGNNINNGKILIESNVSNLSSMNGWARYKNTFLIGSNGHTLSPVEDRENSPAITEYYKNYPQREIIRPSYTCNVTASDGSKVSLSGITPDSSWYRKDPNIPTYTITAIIPDSSNGPHITGFAPSEDNPFNPGEKKIFRIWTDENLTEMNWTVDGEQVANGTLNYIWNVTEGNHKIEFSGRNTNGDVSQVWNIGEKFGGTILDIAESVLEKLQNASLVSVVPQYHIVRPGEQFSLNIQIEPATEIIGAQFDLFFKELMANVDAVKEGNLFSQKGASTYYSNGTVDSNAGLVRHIYGSILGESNVSSPGTIAVINLTAGYSTGIIEFNLSNVIISDGNSSRLPNSINNCTVLIDTAPELDPIGSKSINATRNLTFKISAKDADGDDLTFSASSLPNGANFDPTTGVFTWVPLKGQGGFYTVTFKVSDGYLDDSEDMEITVSTPNNGPSITSFEPANGSVFNEGDNITIALRASDADGQALSYVIKIDGTVYSTSSDYIWNTNYSSSGSHTLELTVSDGIEEVKKVNTIYINDVYPRWDVNKDGVVDIRDVTIVSRKYGTITKAPYPNWDVNQDGKVDKTDLDIVNSHFGEKVK